MLKVSGRTFLTHALARLSFVRRYRNFEIGTDSECSLSTYKYLNVRTPMLQRQNKFFYALIPDDIDVVLAAQ